ncbi:MAG: hypothetical protein JW963_07535 [Anaerolineales bacterium]|nr:hypothetical protein [Anaerolineales bacterium]
MITPSDFLHLPYAPDLTEGGIAYAIRSLPYTYDRMGGSPFDRLRRIVAGVAVELAFRRYLSQRDIPYDVKGATPFTDPDRYDVSLGGHRCDIKSFLISRRDQISSLRTQPELLLKAPALVPSDQHAADGHREDDLYLFAFLTGLIAASQEDLGKALNANQPAYLIHAMPKAWSKPANWQPINPLTFKSESDQTLTVEIGGQAQGREFLTRRVELPPHTRVKVDDAFYAVASIHIDQLPAARLGIHSPYMGEAYLVDPFAWGNIWVYGMDIILTGYILREEFARKGSQIQPGSRVFQYSKTRTKNLAVPIADLKPLGRLFEQVKGWEAQNR